MRGPPQCRVCSPGADPATQGWGASACKPGAPRPARIGVCELRHECPAGAGSPGVSVLASLLLTVPLSSVLAQAGAGLWERRGRDPSVQLKFIAVHCDCKNLQM